VHPHPAVRIVDRSLGTAPESLPLNADFRADSLKLKLTVQISWSPPNAREALCDFGQRFERISPSFARHRCGGRGGYDIHALLLPGCGPGNGDLEAGLALAHLMEHVMIDVVAFVSNPGRVSGATGARRDANDRYDVFVECEHPAVADLAVELALTWVADRGTDLDRERKAALEAAQELYVRHPLDISVEEAAALRGIETPRMARGFAWLAHHGIASLESYAMNFSGLLVYRLSNGARRLAAGAQGPGSGAR
jgi:hypothetical protein